MDKLNSISIQSSQKLSDIKKNEFSTIHFFGFGLITINIYFASTLFRKYHPKLIFGTTGFNADGVEGIKRKRFSSLAFKILSDFDYIVCISDQLFKSWSDYFIDSHSPKVVKIFNPVNLLKYNYVETLSQNKTLKLNYTGNISSRKQILFLLKSIKLAQKKYGVFFKLTIVGTYKKNKDYMEKVRKFIEANQMNDYVEFVGYKLNTEEYYKNSDIFIFASKIEGMPNVVIEAMASGLPIIMREIKGVSESLVEPNNNGFIVENEEEMADKIWYYHKHKDILKNHSLNSRQKAIDNFHPDKTYKKYFELYSHNKSSN